MASKSWSDMVDESEGEGGGGWDPIPDGEYDLVISEAKSQFAASGKKMFVVTTEVQDGPFASRKIWHNFVISDGNPKAMGIFFTQMDALGLPREYFKGNPSDSDITKILQGRRFRGAVGKRVFNDQERNEIRRIYKAKSTGPTSLPSTSAAAAGPPPETVSVPSPNQANISSGIPDIPPF